jgi:hypothetical protein
MPGIRGAGIEEPPGRDILLWEYRNSVGAYRFEPGYILISGRKQGRG